MPKELKILIHPNPILRAKSKPLSPAEILTPEFQTFLSDLEETMIKKDGAGLASPQVGKNIRAVAIHHEGKTMFLINPEISKRSWAREVEEEGCLSVLDEKGEIIYAPVERHKKINCIYIDEKGIKQKLAAEKMLARVIQHELDHLDGILFIDRLAKRKK